MLVAAAAASQRFPLLLCKKNTNMENNFCNVLYTGRVYGSYGTSF